MADPTWLAGVWDIFNQAGVPPEVWVPIMLHESGARPAVQYNTIGQTTKPGIVPEWSIGLFQINVHAKAVRADGTRVLTVAQEADLAEQLKDPIVNATYAAKNMAPAWNVVKGLNLPADQWAGAVGVRSGWPAGSVANPCVSDYCQKIAVDFSGTFKQWAKAIDLPNFAAGADLIAPFFNAGGSSTSGNAAGGGAGSGGQSAYNSVTTAPGYPPGAGGGGNSGGAVGSGSTSATPTTAPGSSGIDAGAIIGALFQTGEMQATKDFHDWLQTDGALSLLFFVVGLGLLLVAVAAILFEKQKESNAVVVNALGLDTAKGKGAANAALNSGSSAAPVSDATMLL